jgi:hypothetical protein
MPETEPSLYELLHRFCLEADSANGVTGPTARALYATIEESERLLEASKRLMAEIHDDGITEKSLAFARAALAVQPEIVQTSDAPADAQFAGGTPGSRLETLTEKMNFLYLASQVRLMRDLQNQVEREGAVATSDLAKAARGSGRIIDGLLDEILGPRDYVPNFQPEKNASSE